MRALIERGLWFPLMLVGLLLVSVGANIYLIVRATNDPSFAVEPDYYAKAVAWDELQAERARSEELGWAMSVAAGHDALEVELRDALGRPVDGAEVEVVAFHNARASERIEARLRPRGRGIYEVERSFPRPGLWEYRFTAVRGDDKFLHVTQEELP
jgi:nitrogen fixation protein FixH